MAPQGKLKQGSKAVSMYEAKGILVGALGVLAVHVSYSREQTPCQV